MWASGKGTLIGVVALVTAASGCATDSTAEPAESPEVSVTSQPTPSSSTPPLVVTATPSGPVSQAIMESPDVQAAIADWAERRGVEPATVSVVSHAEVTWSDGSLGCPEKGRMYTQALVPGRLLVLSAEGRAASYHAAAKGPFSYCATPVPPASSGAIEDPNT